MAVNPKGPWQQVRHGVVLGTMVSVAIASTAATRNWHFVHQGILFIKHFECHIQQIYFEQFQGH